MRIWFSISCAWPSLARRAAFSSASRRLAPFSEKYSLWSAFLLGLVLAFAFCPYSSAIYFGLMLPMSCASDWGVLFPFLFSIGAALPLIFIAWVMFKGMESKLDVWNKFQHFEYWFRKIIAVIFIITGLLFVWEYFLD